MKKSEDNSINQQILSWENNEEINVDKSNTWTEKVNESLNIEAQTKSTVEDRKAKVNTTTEVKSEENKEKPLNNSEQEELDMPWAFAMDNNIEQEFVPDWRYIKQGEAVEIPLVKNILAYEGTGENDMLRDKKAKADAELNKEQHEVIAQEKLSEEKNSKESEIETGIANQGKEDAANNLSSEEIKINNEDNTENKNQVTDLSDVNNQSDSKDAVNKDITPIVIATKFKSSDEEKNGIGNGGNGGKKGRKPRYKRIIGVILLVVLAVLAFLGYYFIFRDPFPHVANSKSVNILVLGVDKRAKDGGRSDTMMLLSLNKETKQLSILSLPRDTRVEIKDGDYEKLNHAYAYGGVKLSKKMVEGLLNVPVHYYVEIDLQAFETFIDDIGGIDVDVKKRMHYEDPYDDNGGLVIDFDPGVQHLDGKKAMEYVRYRDEEGDIGRIQRQQEFMNGVLKKVAAPDNLVKLPGIISDLIDKVATNLSAGDVLKMLPLLPEIKDRGIKTYMLPGKPAYINGVSYWLPEVVKDREEAAEIMGINCDFSKDEKTKAYVEKYNRDLPTDMYKLEDGTEVYEGNRETTSSNDNIADTDSKE